MELSDPYNNYVLARAPVCYWRLGGATGDFVDLGSAMLNAVPSGAGLLRQQSDYWAETNAIALVSADDFVEIASSSALDFVSAVSVEVLVKWSGAQAGTILVARWPGVASTVKNWRLSTDGINVGRLVFRVYVGGVEEYTATAGSYNDGNWHHIVGVYDGSMVRLYVDGVEAATPKPATGNLSAGNMPVRIGRYSDYLNGQFSGTISHVALYDRALSREEVVNSVVNVRGIPRDTQQVKSFAALHNRYFL